MPFSQSASTPKPQMHHFPDGTKCEHIIFDYLPLSFGNKKDGSDVDGMV